MFMPHSVTNEFRKSTAVILCSAHGLFSVYDNHQVLYLHVSISIPTTLTIRINKMANNLWSPF